MSKHTGKTIRIRLHGIAAVLAAAFFAISFHQVAAQKPSSVIGNDPRYIQALRALDEGIPQVSIQKLNECLASKLSADDRALAAYQLARALLSAGRGDDALKALQPLPAQYPGADFLKAQALASLGLWQQACPVYHQLAAQKDALPSYKIGEAECQHALGRTLEAIRVMESVIADGAAGTAARLRLADFYIEADQLEKCAALLDTVQPATPALAKWKKYTGGRLLLASRKYEQALAAFHETLSTGEGLSANLLVGTTLGMADARLALGGPEAAGGVIENFIWQNPDIAGIDILFRRLDQIYAMEKAPSDSELQKWADKTPPARCSVLAVYYLARALSREGKYDKALETLEAFISGNPGNPLVAEAYLLKGNILIDQQESASVDPQKLTLADRQKLGTAIKAFDAAIRLVTDGELLAGAEMAAATAHFRLHEFNVAQGLFQNAAQHSGRLWQKAVFNSALSWLNQANYDKFLSDYKTLGARFPDSEFLPELRLEEGLLQARSGDSRAANTLQGFIRDFPRHPRASEARLALAEIAFLSPDQDLDAANHYLKASNDTWQTGDTKERAAYLAVFLADSAANRNNEKVVSTCLQFINDYPASPLLADVYMKLGQVYFRMPDYPRAETEFDLLAHKIPDSPLAETALFLAGQSALKMMNTDRALELFQEVAKLPNGSLKLYARQQQAIVYTRLHTKQGEQDAISMYDDILAGGPDADLRFAALCGKGDNYFLLGGDDPKYFDQAIAAYNELATQPDATAYWRNQALYYKGKCYEKLKKQNEALAAFYDVIQPQTKRNDGPEYLWFYKAGFDAAHILESQEQWKAAIAIYQKMATLKGPRSDEAKEMLTQLRLKHFIWEE
ncbi:MAG: tetratricopeptide repeat protein [Chthoniobacteraceae bacterium]